MRAIKKFTIESIISMNKNRDRKKGRERERKRGVKRLKLKKKMLKEIEQ